MALPGYCHSTHYCEDARKGALLERIERIERIERGKLDPSRIIMHTLSLDEAPHGYDIFKHKREGCVKVVLEP